MSAAQRWRLALLGLGRSRGGPFVLLLAVGVAGLYLAAAGWAGIVSERARPCEIRITASGASGLTARTVEDILSIPEVLDATGVYALSLTVTGDGASANLTVAGLEADHLQIDLTEGSLFPATASMPWLVLGDEAIKKFTDDDGRKAAVSLTGEQVSLTLNDVTVPAGVSGVFAAGDGDADGYMSGDMARALLQAQGLGQSYDYILARLENTGAQEAAAEALAALGCQAEATDTALAGTWAARGREAVYQLMTGAAFLLCAIMHRRMTAALRREETLARRQALAWMGMTAKQARSPEAYQTAVLSVLALLLGIAAGAAGAALGR